MGILYLYILVMIVAAAYNSYAEEQERWNLPVLPKEAPHKWSDNITNSKLIPQDLWIARVNKDDELSYQMKPLFDRNPTWRVHLEGNEEKDAFMNTVFAGTSLLWAYDMIHPLCGAAKADIWRYAVLWTYGGMYMDDDSDIGTPLDKIVEPLDEMIVTHEKNGFNADTCYLPQYKLSDIAAFKGVDSSKNGQRPRIFHSSTLPNWALFSAPRHKFLENTMYNVVEMIRSDYFRSPYVRDFSSAHKWKLVMCSTGPAAFTASAREALLADPSIKYKLTRTDFGDYGGKFKAVSTRSADAGLGHYMNMGKPGHAQGLLKEYKEERALSDAELAPLEKKAIQGHNGKAIYVVEGGQKRVIPNWDTFVHLGYSLADLVVITDYRLQRIPDGADMPPCEKCG